MGAKYGQHFLINSHAAERIIESMHVGPQDNVLEIGPGKGALTAYLLKVGHVAVVEIDEEMVGLLKARFGSAANVHVYQSDILQFDFATLNEFKLGERPFKVVGNLPYNLTSPILRRLSEWKGWEFATIMVQKEVADRLCARHATPEYGALTAGMSLTCRAEMVFELSPTSFKPAPKVKSAVVKLIRRETPLTADIEGTQKVIQAAFQQRRKTILNSLSHGLLMDKLAVEKTLIGLGIDPLIRAEKLPVETFVQLSAALLKNAPLAQ